MQLVDFSTYKKVEKTRPFRVPASCQKYLPVEQITKDGIFKLSTKDQYSAMWQFEDIGYRGFNGDEKDIILLQLAQVYDTMTDSFKVIIINHQRSKAELKEKFLFNRDNCKTETYTDQEQENSLTELKTAYDELIQERIQEGRKGLKQDKYVLVTTSRRDMASASSHFVEVESQLSENFEQMGSRLERVDAAGRVGLLHEFFHPGESNYQFDFDTAKKLRRDWKNDVCPSAIKQAPNELEIEGRYCRVIYLREWPKSGIDDRFLSELTGLPYPLVVTLDVAPIPQEATFRQIDDIYMKIQSKLQKERQTAADRGTIATENYYYTSDLENLKRTADSMKENDENLFFVGLTVVVSADSLEDLNQITESIRSLSAGYSFELSPLWLKQREGLMTALPVGVRQIDTMRTLLSQRVAAFIPFSTKDFMHPDGVYYGQNPDSRQPIFLDQKLLENGNALVFGKSGFGKSFLGKFTKQQVLLREKDHARFIFIDPQCEKKQLVEQNAGSYIQFGINSPNRMNPLEVPERVLLDYSQKDEFIAQKIMFLMAFLQLNNPEFIIGGVYKSLINRCTLQMYNEWFDNLARFEKNKEFLHPQLEDFYRVLRNQEEPEARELAVSLETLIEGPLAIFNCQSTVNLENPVIGFGFYGLSKDLLGNALLIVMEYISNNIQLNDTQGYMTWVDVEEFHYVTKFPVAAEYFHEWYKMIRKCSGFLTATTQNLIDVARNETMKSIISNSELIILMAQNKADVDLLVEITGMDPQRIRKLQIAQPGTGIIKYGSSLVEFDNRLPKESIFYKLWQTDGNKAKTK